jgi:hypothetical protein
MVLVSSPASVSCGRPSLLAIIETIAASSISVWFAWKYQSIEHIVIASTLAPFLLLRTRLSTRYTLRVIYILEERNFGFLFLIPLIKIISFIRVFLRHPLLSIQIIPGNFYKYTTTIDSFVAPQVIPGTEEMVLSRIVPHKGTTELLDGYELVKALFGVFTSGAPLFYLILFGPVVLALVVPGILLSFSFRLSIKSSAWLWLPLLWVIRQSRPGSEVMDRIELNTAHPWAKLVLTYSIFVILGFTLKVVLLFGVWRFEDLSWLGPLGILATRLVAPAELPLWHIAAALNAVLAWAYFSLARRRVLARNKPTEAWPEGWIEREYVAFQAVRTTLSLYAIACTFYIAAATAWQTRWPPIHFILFPRLTDLSLRAMTIVL